MSDFKPLALFLITIALSLYLPVNSSELARLHVQGFFSPVTRFVTHSRIKAAGVFSFLDGMLFPLSESQKKSLVTVNGSMRDRLVTMSDKVTSLERKLREVQAQQEMSQAKEFTPIGANVLGRNYQHFLDEVTIDIGSNEGVTEGMGVVQGSKVLGRIKACTATTSTVALLVHGTCRIATRIQRNQKQGLLEGGKATGLDLRCRMKYLFDGGKPGEPAAAKLGDRVVTSGSDPVFPSGLFVGEVSAVDKPGMDMFYRVEVRPAIDLSSIYSVVVLRPTEKYRD